MFKGPVLQNTGHACELVLKWLLFGGGISDEQLRKNFGHSVSKLYERAEDFIEITRFLQMVIDVTRILELPAEVAGNLAGEGYSPEKAHARWRMFTGHIHLLDPIYKGTLRTRYFQPGAIVLPEPVILLIGTEILLNAMNERLGLPLVRELPRRPQSRLSWILRLARKGGSSDR